jgi:PAS domain S-box-containing protein
MSLPLQLLFVGVAQPDAERLLQPLCADGFAPQSMHAADADEVDARLSGAAQVLVVAVLAGDVEMLERVVAVLRQRMLDIPVLAYAADGSHDNIVDAMRAGAQDFITVKHVARILPAVRRELVSVRMRAEQKEQIVSDYLLSEIDQLILRGMEVAPLLRRVCERMFELFELKLVWIGGKQAGGEVTVLASAGETAYLDGLDVRWDDSPKGNGAAGKAIKLHQPQLLLVDEVDFAPWRDQAERFGVSSVLALPMVTRSEVIGTLMLYSTRRDAFGEAAIKRFQAFTDRLAVGLLACQEQQQSRLLSAAMNAANNAMFITERDGTIVWFNQALNLFSGYSNADILNCNPRMFSSGEHSPEFWCDMWEMLSQAKPWRNEVVNRRKDGHVYTVMQTITPLYDDAGELTFSCDS